jgi:hypothetical protein
MLWDGYGFLSAGDKVGIISLPGLRQALGFRANE